MQYMGIHTGEKSYVCTHEATHTDSLKGRNHMYADMKRHMWVHTGEKPFVCIYEASHRFTQERSHMCAKSVEKDLLELVI